MQHDVPGLLPPPPPLIGLVDLAMHGNNRPIRGHFA